MKHDSLSKPLIVATLLSVGLIGLLLSPFFAVIATAVLLAYSFLPLHKRILKRVKQQSIAAMLTFIAASFIVIIPLVIVLSVTVSQAVVLAQQISDASADIRSENGLEDIVEQATTAVESVSGGLVRISEEDLASYGATLGSEIISAVVNLITNVATSAPAFFTGTILFVYLFLGLLMYYRELLKFFRSINPLGDKIFDIYISKAQAMTDGMVRGQFLIALAQGAIGAISFVIAGIPYAMFFFVLLSFLSIIPLGGGVISIPLGIILLFTGNIWQGLLILLVHFIIVGNIDNILRPILIPKAARLPSALLLLGVFSGLYWFGFLGLFIGPIFLILGLTTLQVYSLTTQSVPSPVAKTHSTKP